MRIDNATRGKLILDCRDAIDTIEVMWSDRGHPAGLMAGAVAGGAFAWFRRISTVNHSLSQWSLQSGPLNKKNLLVIPRYRAKVFFLYGHSDHVTALLSWLHEFLEADYTFIFGVGPSSTVYNCTVGRLAPGKDFHLSRE